MQDIGQALTLDRLNERGSNEIDPRLRRADDQPVDLLKALWALGAG
jgi:hypothetical protein